MQTTCDFPDSLQLIPPEVEVSSVVVHRVPPRMRERFLELQRGITRAAEQFAGYRRTEIYPPADACGDQWVVVLHFDDRAALDAWLDSPERAAWVAHLQQELGNYRLSILQNGFGPWFARLAGTEVTVPPNWKMALTVWLGLYPTVMLLTLLVSPFTDPLGLALSILIGNAVSVSILQWLVMPALTRALRPWLTAPPEASTSMHFAPPIAIASLLVAMALVFRLLMG